MPKGFELKCSMKDRANYVDDINNEINENIKFKTCEEDIIGENNDNKCGEGHGKCPSGQCCSKDGECGTTDDYCLVTKKCQMAYGNCIDECEEIYKQLKNIGIENVNRVTCTPNEEGKAKEL